MEANPLELSDTPYPGLRPFRSDEADIFFGRERQTDELLSRLAAHRFLAVVGPSGCGKSSLVAAGLMPALATGFMATAGAHWRIAKLRPGERPLANLAAALVEARVLDDERATQPDAPVFLEAALRRGPLGLVEILRGSALAPDANLLVLVDQFEELFRFSAGVQRDEAEAFVALLLASAAAPHGRIYIAITMRSDFLGECAPFHGLPEAINDGLYLTPRLTRDQCAACITGPARVFDADVEPALVNRLLNDFGPDPDQLPLLQHALLRMWNRHDPDRRSGEKTVLTVPDYAAIGGLARSLSDHADEAFGELDPEHQRIAKLMFRRLSDSETARHDRRATAHVRDIAELAGATIDDVRRVADVFRRRDRCFLTPRDHIALTSESILDVSHESLLRQWGRVVRWIEEEADMVAAYRRLRDSARAWREGDALMTEASLDRALAWYHQVSISWARRYGTDDDFHSVCDFIGASERTRIQRTRIARIRRSIALGALGVLAIAGVLGWFGRPLLYVWEHTTYYASLGRVDGVTRGLGELTEEQVRHRPLSYRVATAGLLGRVLRIDALNGRGELTEVDPEYSGERRGRVLRTARWVYVYDATGEVAAEHQYTSRDELVQSKIYTPDGDARLTVFISPDGTPTPVQDRIRPSISFWTEQTRRSKTDVTEQHTIRHLGWSGEPLPGIGYAFATRFTYDRSGSLISTAALDSLERPMNTAMGHAKLIHKNDEFGNQLETRTLDKQDHLTNTDLGWSIRRQRFDTSGNLLEEAYFDRSDEPTVLSNGWHRRRFRRDVQGNIVETHYFDRKDSPTRDSETSCYGITQQNDAAGRRIRWTCLDAAGQPHKTLFGYVTRTVRYDDQGHVVEEATLDDGDHPTTGRDSYAIRRNGYDDKGRPIETLYLGPDGKPINSSEGYTRAVTNYDDSGKIEWIRFLGIDGEPIALKNGSARVMRKRDNAGNVVEARYYDGEGHAVVTNDRYAGWRAAFDTRGQNIETVYLGMSDEVLLNKDGYAGQRAVYDDLGRTIAVYYFGLMKEPVTNLADGVAGWQSRYDDCGHEVERMYVGLDGTQVMSFHGEAGWRATYDARGNQIKVQFIDTGGASTLHAWDDDASFRGLGYASLTRTFDDHGELLEEAYFGVRGEPIVRPEGWSSVRHSYDDLGRRVRTSYFGVNGEAVTLPDGYHAMASTYDDRGDVAEIRYLGLGDTPVVTRRAVARVVSVHDRYHHLVEETVFGARDERVTADSGAHRTVLTWDDHGRQTRDERWGPDQPPNRLGATEFRYDIHGNTIEERHLDPEDQPRTTATEPCPIRRWKFSIRQEPLEERCVGANGALSRHLSNGAARIMYTYDQRGNKLEEMYVDENDQPFTTSHGFAGVKYRYDSLGRDVEVAYIDVRHHQVVNKSGYARIAKKYDARGNLVERAYFLANDSPTAPVAKIESEFDALGRKIMDRYVGPGGTPAYLHGGQHVTLYEYDAYGNVRSLRYLDVQGRPTRGYARDFFDSFEGSWQLCGRWVARYGDDGKLIGNGKCEPALPVAGPAAM